MSKFSELAFGSEYVDVLCEAKKRFSILGEDATDSDRPSPIADAIVEYYTTFWHGNTAKAEKDIETAIKRQEIVLGTNPSSKEARKLLKILFDHEVKDTQRRVYHGRNYGVIYFEADDGTTRVKISFGFDSSD